MKVLMITSLIYGFSKVADKLAQDNDMLGMIIGFIVVMTVLSIMVALIIPQYKELKAKNFNNKE